MPGTGDEGPGQEATLENPQYLWEEESGRRAHLCPGCGAGGQNMQEGPVFKTTTV